MNIEKEIKILLSKEDYQRVKLLFEWDKEVTQKNYYYVNSENITCYCNEPTIRIRKKEGKYKLQIKIGVGKEKSCLHVKEEYEKPMFSVPDTISRTELKELTNADFKNDVLLIGNLVTCRKTCAIYDNTEISLDKNFYLGIEDYEIEIEYVNNYPNEIMEYLSKNGITSNKPSVGKFSRFMRRNGLLINKKNSRYDSAVG